MEFAPVKLELSAKLAPTILVIDDENGFKRQYRLTNKSRDGRKLYFRCSRCDTLIKKDGQRIRAKLIVQDGVIVSEQFPEHHPECEAKTQEDIFVQQIDRSSRRDVKDGRLLPQDAYKVAVNRVLSESVQDPSVVGAVDKFPDWPRLRQQYCRIRKTAVSKRFKEEHGVPDHHRYATRSSRKYSPGQGVGVGPAGIEYDVVTTADHDGGDDGQMVGANEAEVEEVEAYAAAVKQMHGHQREMDEMEDDDTIINVDDDMYHHQQQHAGPSATEEQQQHNVSITAATEPRRSLRGVVAHQQQH